MSQTCEHGIPVDIACGYCILFASNKALKAELEQAKANSENWRQDANRYSRALNRIADMIPDHDSLGLAVEIANEAVN